MSLIIMSLYFAAHVILKCIALYIYCISTDYNYDSCFLALYDCIKKMIVCLL